MISAIGIKDNEHRRVISSLAEYVDGRRKSVINADAITDSDLRSVIRGIADSKANGTSLPSLDRVTDIETRRVLGSIINRI